MSKAKIRIFMLLGPCILASTACVSSPLEGAAERNDDNAVSTLLQQGASKDEMNKALETAAFRGSLDVVRLLLDRGADVNTTIWLGETPLHQAADGKHLETAKLLLERGADPNVKTSEYGQNRGWTPLHYAAYRENEEMVKLLLGSWCAC